MQCDTAHDTKQWPAWTGGQQRRAHTPQSDFTCILSLRVIEKQQQKYRKNIFYILIYLAGTFIQSSIKQDQPVPGAIRLKVFGLPGEHLSLYLNILNTSQVT